MKLRCVMWSTRIWRNIDVREKINQQLYYPIVPNGNRVALFDILSELIKSGEIHVYTFNPVDLDDTYKMRMTLKDVMANLSRSDTVTDENGNVKVVPVNVDAGAIKGYTLKEDWIFERQQSILIPRILFICPKVENINSNTGKEDENGAPLSLFWIYFENMRPVMAKTPVFNQQNDAERRTFDDIFLEKTILKLHHSAKQRVRQDNECLCKRYKMPSLEKLIRYTVTKLQVSSTICGSIKRLICNYKNP